MRSASCTWWRRKIHNPAFPRTPLFPERKGGVRSFCGVETALKSGCSGAEAKKDGQGLFKVIQYIYLGKRRLPLDGNDIQKACGHDVLPFVCTSYPRRFISAPVAKEYTQLLSLRSGFRVQA